MINWIASYPKSGNTWVRLFLTAYVTGHLDINHEGVTLYDGSKYLHRVLSPGPLDHENNIYLRPAVLLHLIASTRYKPTLVKTHWANVVIGGITAIPRPLTEAAVYLVRDPRDVCVSFSRHIGKSIDQTIYEMANPHNLMYESDTKVGTWLTTWSNHVETWERDFTTVVRYEDLRNDPEIHFARILEAYRLKLNKQRLKKAVRLCDIERLKKQERAGFVEIGQQDKFFGQGQGWQQELTDKQARRIVEDHHDIMKRYGYLSDDKIRKIA